MDVPLWIWFAFLAFIIGMLAVDLGVFNREVHVVSFKESAIWTTVWVVVSLLFCVGIWIFAGGGHALEFLTGYLVEKSLAVDNIFIFVLIFAAFSVPPVLQHRVLFWGIIGALVLRGTLILIGAVLIAEFHWILYVFGAFLVFTGIRMIRQRDDEEFDVAENPVIRTLRRIMPVTPDYHGNSFFTRAGGQRFATPLFAVILVVMVTDVVFAVDSIPAIFAITQDSFIVFTSNICAVLGLRAMYFMLADIVRRFRYLKHGLSFILVYIGVKMLLIDVYHIPTLFSLGVIAAILTIAILASARATRNEEAAEQYPSVS
ncbi:MAG: TerC family protein [Chloroflexota bacterium]